MPPEAAQLALLHNPHAVVVVGNSEDLDDRQCVSLDLFRKSNKDVSIITYNELFKRVGMLREVFLYND
jgi:hypothetical protein